MERKIKEYIQVGLVLLTVYIPRIVALCRTLCKKLSRWSLMWVLIVTMNLLFIGTIIIGQL